MQQSNIPPSAMKQSVTHYIGINASVKVVRLTNPEYWIGQRFRGFRGQPVYHRQRLIKR